MLVFDGRPHVEDYGLPILDQSSEVLTCYRCAGPGDREFVSYLPDLGQARFRHCPQCQPEPHDLIAGSRSRTSETTCAVA